MDPLSYQDAGVWDPETGDYSPYPDYSGGVDFGSSDMLNVFSDLGKMALNTWSQKTLMQQNQQGRRYIEGQRLAMLQSQGIGGISTGTLLLIGGAFLIYSLMKG